MSKRVADGQGGSERYGGIEDARDSTMDPPRKATAAQLAKRSIKPLKGRPGSSSRSSSPSKTSPAPSFNPFGAADGNPFAQSAPAPPAAATFNFGQSATQAQSNPFGSMSTSQSFPPAAPVSGNTAFSFGQSQPANAPSFAPPQSSSFNFGAATPSGTSFSFGASPANPPQQTADGNKTSSFTFGSTPASPAPSAPASPAPAFNPFSAMSGSSFGGAQPISAAEIHEIESAGPRLSQQGKLDQLANIVRHSEPKYKDADLGGLDLAALPAAVQRKMLDFVRANPDTVSPRYSGAHGSADADAPPLFAHDMPQTYTHLPAFGEEHFMTNGVLDEPKLAQAAADPCMPIVWQTGIAALQSRLDEKKNGMDPIHSYSYFGSSQSTTVVQPSPESFNPNAIGHVRPFQPFNSVEGHGSPFVKHPDLDCDIQHDMVDAPYQSFMPTMQHQHAQNANNQLHQTQPEAPKSSFSFSSTAAPTSFSFGASTATAPSSSQPEAQSSPFKGFGAAPSPSSPAPSSGFKFGSTAEPAKKDEPAPATSAFAGFGASTANKDDTPAKTPSSAFKFGAPAASPAPAAPSSSPSFSFGVSTASPAPAASFNFGAPADKKDEAAPKPPAAAFNFGAAAEKTHEAAPKPAAIAFSFGASASPAAPPSPKPAEKKLPSFAFASPAAADAAKPAESVSYPSLNGAPSPQEPSPAPTPSFNFGQTATPAASSPFKPATTESPKPQNAGLGSSIFSSAPAPTPQKPAESAFKGFGASTSAPSQSTTAPSAASGFASPISAPPAAPVAKSQPLGSNSLTRSGVATPPASPQLNPSELASTLVKQLNESLRAHLASADVSQDWSAIMRFYLEQVFDIHHGNSAAPSAAALTSSSAPKQITAPLPPPNARGEKRVAEEEATKDDEHSKRSKTEPKKSPFSVSTTSDKPLSTTASLFDDILNSPEKPKTPQQTNVFSASANKTPAPPATAPAAKSNPFGAIDRNVSATPDPSASKSAWNPPAAAQVQPSSKPTPASAFQIPKFGGGGSTTSSTNFLGSFGKQAADAEAKEREKRKEEDMDSDEDEEEWERKDAEKQAQKKAELLAASQATKFSFDASKKSTTSAVFSFGSAPSANSSASTNIFGNLSGSKPDDDDEDNDGDTDEDGEVAATSSQGKSLFDRVSFDADKKTDAPSASFKFSSFGSSGPADNTWKESNTIKFGASTATAGTTTPDGSPAKGLGASVLSSTPAPAPKFNFGSASTPSGNSSGSVFDTAKPSAPTTGFSFGNASAPSAPSAPSALAPPGASIFASAATSRATTPGAATTDAEASAAESEPSDTPNDAQKDLTALTAADTANSDLTLDTRCKVTKFVKNDTHPTGSWQSQGVGPIRILVSQTTCKPRILMRADPSGKVVLNFNALLNKDMYSHKSAKMVQLSVPAEDKKLESFMCMFKDEDKAKEFIGALHEAIAKAQA